MPTALGARIDSGTEWRHVQLAMRPATDAAVGFDEVQVAVVGPRQAGEAARAGKGK